MSKNEKHIRVDPRVIRTRQMLRDAFMALIPEIGYDAITVQHITDRATLNRATFYLHYRDKQDLLNQIIGSVLEELTDAPVTNASDVHEVFVYLFKHVARHAPFYRVMLQEATVAPYVRQMQHHIESIGMSWLSRGDFSLKDMLTPPDLFVSFIGSAYLGVIKWWVLNDMPHSPEYIATQFMRLTIGGVQRDFNMVAEMAALDDQLRQ